MRSRCTSDATAARDQNEMHARARLATTVITLASSGMLCDTEVDLNRTQRPKSSAAKPDTDGAVVDLFLCHNGADKPWTEKLAEHVESETLDGTSSGRLLRVFFDKWD